MDSVLVASLGLGVMFLLIAFHVPIGIAMGLTGVAGVGLIIGWDQALSLLRIDTSGTLAHRDLAIIPLFLVMGSFAGAAELSRDLYRLAYALVGHYRGGLAMATIGACAGFGAVCGSSVATAATMAKVALPEMTEQRYERGFAAGSIAAGGTLGVLIPPSIVLVLYAVLTEQFVIALFVAAMLPGLLAVALHFVAILFYVRLVPGSGPAGPVMPWRERLVVVRQSWGVVFLAVVVSGGIYGGIFTVVEAASVGACIAFLFAFMRGKLNRTLFWQVLREAAINTGLIYMIIMGAHLLTNFVTLTNIAEDLVAMIKGLEFSPMTIIFILLLMYIMLGCIFDTIASIVITLPFVFPLILDLGFHPVWFGVILVMVAEIGMITPPIGINVFVLHGIAKTIPMNVIFRGITPFLLADLVRLFILVVFPVLALWLPMALKLPM